MNSVMANVNYQADRILNHLGDGPVGVPVAGYLD